MVQNNAIKYLLILLLMIAGCAADFQSKKWAESALKGKQPATAIKGLLEFGFVENRGMIFGILNKTMPDLGKKILTGFRVIIIILLSVFIWKYRRHRFLFHLPLALIWAGAIGNLIDPFIYGYVVDFIHLKVDGFLDWPFFFNLADAYVTVGIALWLIFNGHIKTGIPAIR
jgi:signal peptidase II